jgi:polysaccharide export outer membrane protein
LKTVTLGVLVVLIVIAGCGGSKPQQEVAPAAPPRIDLPERIPYKIGLGDQLDIRFPYYPMYNVSLTVRPDGAISMPHVGEVVAEGMEPMELEKLIRARYAEIVAQPEVSVMVQGASDLKIFVFGEVRVPGAHELAGPMTLLDAIAGAGGVTYLARKDNVVLIRRTGDGGFVGSKINLEDILDGRGENPRLMARDVIYVPLSAVGKVDVFVDQFFANLTPAWYFLIAGKEVINPEGKYIFGR